MLALEQLSERKLYLIESNSIPTLLNFNNSLLKYKPGFEHDNLKK